MSASHWRGKKVVITGASDGLGAHLAHAAATQGAHLTLLARRQQPLEAMAERCLKAGAASAETISVDLTSAREVPERLLGLRSTAAGIDLVIHTVGRSDRGMALQVPAEQWESMFQINVLSAVLVAQQLKESLQRQRGALVLIGSLASKVAPAGMGSYPAVKFALAGLAQQLRLELAEEGIHCLLVCPGPIRRDDAGERYRQLAQSRGIDPKLAAPGGGAKVRSLDPLWLSEKILAAAADRKPELVVPSKVRWLAAIAQLAPRWGDWILRRKMS
jgi:short-subunit dehydrogenase